MGGHLQSVPDVAEYDKAPLTTATPVSPTTDILLSPDRTGRSDTGFPGLQQCLLR